MITEMWISKSGTIAKVEYSDEIITRVTMNDLPGTVYPTKEFLEIFVELWTQT